MIHSQNGTMTFEEHSFVLNGSGSLMVTECNLSAIQPPTELSLSNPVQNPVSSRNFPGTQNKIKCKH